jgi:hypothetical protein
MAKFDLELPTAIIDDTRKIYENADEIFGKMTKAGADVVRKNIEKNVPKSFHGSNIMHCLYTTRVYKTPSDDGINTKVGFYGYFTNKDGKKVPAPLVANVFEHGRSNLPFVKHPFLRKSFRKADIEAAMMKEQRKESGGLLDDE